MDVVDINVNSHKYTSNGTKRHTCTSNNITHWNQLEVNNINSKNVKFVSNYSKFLDQRNIQIIIKCIEQHIHIVPILYQLNHDDIKLLIKKSFEHVNIHMLKILHNYVVDLISHDNLIKYIISACGDGHINVVKYLHREIGLKKEDFQSYDNKACQMACVYGHVDVVKYLHQEIGLTIQDFQSIGNYACSMACHDGHLDVVKYLHQKVGLTKEDFLTNNHFACHIACENGYINVVKYLHQEVGLTKQDFKSHDNYACIIACVNGHIGIVKYLHQEVGLTKQDFQSDNNYAYKYALKNKHNDVVEYLLTVICIFS